MRRRADVFLERENETRIEIFARGTRGFRRIRLAVQVSEEYWANREGAHAGNDEHLDPAVYRSLRPIGPAGVPAQIPPRKDIL